MASGPTEHREGLRRRLREVVGVWVAWAGVLPASGRVRALVGLSAARAAARGAALPSHEEAAGASAAGASAAAVRGRRAYSGGS